MEKIKLSTEFFSNNREDFVKNLNENEYAVTWAGEAPVICADNIYDFSINRNFYYLTGLDRELYILFIGKNSSGKKVEMLFIERKNPELEKWVGYKLTKEDAGKISGIKNIFYIDEFECYIDRYLHSCNKLYMDYGPMSLKKELYYKHEFINKVRELHPHIEFGIFNDKIRPLRQIKKAEEIEMLKTAIHFTKLGIENMWKNKKPELYEYQLEAYFNFILDSNQIKKGFPTICASGVNAAVLHYHDNNTKIEENSMVLIDLGAEYNYYSADISRTFPIAKKYSARHKDVYKAVLDVQKKVIEEMKPGKTMADINKLTNDETIKALKNLKLIENDDEMVKYYYHSVGHHLGLNTHDVGERGSELKPGMVITCEPGIYIKEEGIGVRIEDDILITENGNENLSEDIIKEVEDIENF